MLKLCKDLLKNPLFTSKNLRLVRLDNNSKTVTNINAISAQIFWFEILDYSSFNDSRQDCGKNIAKC